MKHPRLLKTALAYLVGIAIFTLIITVSVPDFNWSDIRALDCQWRFAPLFLISSVAFFFVSGMRWGYISNLLAGKRLHSTSYYFYYHTLGRLSSQFFTHIGGDLVVKPLATRREGEFSFSKGVLSVILDRLFDTLILVAFPPPSALFLSKEMSLKATLFVFGGCVLALYVLLALRGMTLLLRLRKIRLAILEYVKGLLGRASVTTAPGSVESGTGELGRSALIFVFHLTVVRYLIISIQIFSMAKLFGLDMALEVVITVVPVIQLSMLFAFTPGALGILEGGWLVVLHLLHMPKPAVAAFLVGQRVSMYISICIVFIISYVILCLGGSTKKILLLRLRNNAQPHSKG